MGVVLRPAVRSPRMHGGLVGGFVRRLSFPPFATPAGRGPRRVLGSPAGGLTGQGVGSETAAPKISELPNVAGQSAWGAGLGAGVPVRSDSRHVSRAGQSAALRTSFQTPTAPPRVAAVYT